MLKILSEDKVLSVNGSTTAKSANNYKSQYDTGTEFTVAADQLDKQMPVGIVVLFAEYPGGVTCTVKENGAFRSTFSGQVPNTVQIAPIGYGSGWYMFMEITMTSDWPATFTLTFNNSVKVSRFMVGNVWSPKYDVNYGIQVGYTDTTTVERLHGGDLYTVTGPRNKYLRFDLQYVDETNRQMFFNIGRLTGRSKPIFVSVFPNDSDPDKRQMYSIMGTLVTPPNMTHTMYTMYATSIEIEEL